MLCRWTAGIESHLRHKGHEQGHEYCGLKQVGVSKKKYQVNNKKEAEDRGKD